MEFENLTDGHQWSIDGPSMAINLNNAISMTIEYYQWVLDYYQETRETIIN